MGLLQFGGVVFLDLDIHDGEDGLVVRAAQLHDMVIGLDLDGILVDSLASLVENTIAPGRSTALLAFLLIVVCGVFFIFVGWRELDLGLDEVIKRQASTLGDFQLHVSQVEGNLVLDPF